MLLLLGGGVSGIRHLQPHLGMLGRGSLDIGLQLRRPGAIRTRQTDADALFVGNFFSAAEGPPDGYNPQQRQDHERKHHNTEQGKGRISYS